MKKLYKSRKEKMFAGVCGGIAEYFDLDPVLVRILFVIFTFIGGTAIIAYIVGLIVMPFPPTETAGTTAETPPPPGSTASDTYGMDYAGQPPSSPAPASKSAGKGGLIFGVILVILGAYFLMRNIPWLNHWYWWIRWNLSDYLIPAILIIVGAILIGNSKRKNENGQEG